MSDQSPSEQLSASNDQFTRDFYNVVRSKQGNIFFSPVSLQIALGMVDAGAKGKTAEQLEKATNLPADKALAAQNFNQLITTLNSLSENVTLKTANAVYAQKDFSIRPEYTQTLSKNFGAEANTIDFTQGDAVNTVNKWVSDKTNSKIPKLFESLDQDTKMVLLNAIYFKGDWVHKFEEQRTEKGLFHVTPKDDVEVQFMNIKQKFLHAENTDLDADIVQMPYEGKKVSMVLVVPKKVDGLAQVEEKLQSLQLRELTNPLVQRDVDLKMPKFKLDSTYDLNESFKALGITDMFDSSLADLSGISEHPLYVSKGIHKAFIEVNEKGAEAAAATGLMMATMSMPRPPPVVSLDKPFHFFIHHKITGITLFMGRLSVPVKE